MRTRWRLLRWILLACFAMLVAFSVTTCWVAALSAQKIQSPQPIIVCQYGSVAFGDNGRFQMRVNRITDVLGVRVNDSLGVIMMACPISDDFIGVLVVRNLVPAPPVITPSTGG